MNSRPPEQPVVAVACGGTGGHLFPGLAIARELQRLDCEVLLLLSAKQVDQEAAKDIKNLRIVTLPAVAFSTRRSPFFFAAFARAYRVAQAEFKRTPPAAAISMGGFTAAPAMLAAKRAGAKLFLHESNAVPGRANRWLSWLVSRAFIGFGTTAARLHASKCTLTGTPVRAEFSLGNAAGELEPGQEFLLPAPSACRETLGLEPEVPTILVMGGSQGASAINSLFLEALPMLTQGGAGEAAGNPPLQFIHLTGVADFEKVRTAYRSAGLKAVVHPFFAQMHLVLGAATLAVSRAGASSLAEFAATRLPAVLIPYPAAMDNHQFYNAREFEQTGAACLFEQRTATAAALTALLLDLLRHPTRRERMRLALARWHSPNAASDIAGAVVAALPRTSFRRAPQAPWEQPLAPSISVHSVALENDRHASDFGKAYGSSPVRL